jgi:hypothetical protein
MKIGGKMKEKIENTELVHRRRRQTMPFRAFRVFRGFLIIVVLFAVSVFAGDGLIAHWSFDEGRGTNVVDSSGNGWNGILEGRPLPVWTNGLSGTALSFAAGSKAIPCFEGYNFNMTGMKNGWPLQRLNDPRWNTRWLHSDIKDVAFQFTYQLFATLVEQGGLK